MSRNLVPLEVERGCDFVYKATFVDENGNPDDVSAFTYDAFVKKNFTDADVVIEFSIDFSQTASGDLFLILNDTQTTALDEGTYQARLRRTLNGITTPVWSRQFVVTS
jgi:hypothetical protein